MDTIFAINNKDYSRNVLANATYKVGENDVFNEWTDANEVTHRLSVRTRVSGSFKMMFEKLEEYEEFLEDYRKAMDNDKRAADITIAINYPDYTSRRITAFLTINPVRRLNDVNDEVIDMFDVTVEER